MRNELIDRLYEAAFIPELWGEVASGLSAHLSSREGSLILIGDDSAEWIATPRCSDHIAAHKESFGADPLFYRHARAQRFDQQAHRGFRTERQLLSIEELEADPFQGS